MAGIIIVLAIAYLLFLYLFGLRSDIFSPLLLLCVAVLVAVAALLQIRYSLYLAVNGLANVLLAYVCLVLYLSDMDVRLQVMVIPVLPLLFYLLNPLWLFNVLSMVLFTVMQAMNGGAPPGGGSESEELVLYAYAMVWLALLVEEVVHSKERKKLKSYQHYDEQNNVINQRELMRLLDSYVANAVRYRNKLSLIVFEFYHGPAKGAVKAGDRAESLLLSRVNNNIRRGDVLAKWQGTLFALLIPENDRAGCEQLLLKLQDVVADTQLPGLQGVGLHYGVTELDHQNGQELLQQAELALESGKRQALVPDV